MLSKRKISLRILCFIVSLLIIFSVISFPTIEANADGSAGTLDDFVERCYTVTLDRGSDPDGFADWKGQLLNGKAVGIEVAYGFLFSQEYTKKNKDNDAYLKDLYMLFMGREPDEGGYNDWMGKLNNGASRLEVFAGFANSQEFYNICDSYGITAGRYVMGYDRPTINNVNLFVERMYKITLGRIGDKDGQKNWVEQLINKQITGSECARRFIFSQEYTNKNLGDEEFVENLYLAMFGRSSDTDGKNNWLYGLKNGMTRDEVFAGFANSIEFDNICKTYGIDRGSYIATDKGTFNKDNPNNEEPHIHSFNQENTLVMYLKGKATCTEPSEYYYSCECGEYDINNTFYFGEPLGHQWNEGIITIESTEKSEGKRVYTCNRCGGTKTEIIQKKVLLYNKNDIKIYACELDSFATNEDWIGLDIMLLFENNTNSELSFTVGDSLLNGSKAKAEIFNSAVQSDKQISVPIQYYNFQDTGVTSLEKFKKAEFSIVVHDRNFSELYETEMFCLSYNYNNNTLAKGTYVIPQNYFDKTKSYKKGDIISFGRYEQDGNDDNGKEFIEWIVLSSNEDEILVISKYVLDSVRYGKDRTETWETSYLRDWLNYDFINKSFTNSETNSILSEKVINNKNTYYDTDCGKNTNDKVYCLSVDELSMYYNIQVNNNDGYLWSQYLITQPTQYALNKGLSTIKITKGMYDSDYSYYYNSDVIGKIGCTWWLRTSTNGLVGEDPGHSACVVAQNGITGFRMGAYNSSEYGVRPVIRIELE